MGCVVGDFARQGYLAIANRHVYALAAELGIGREAGLDRVSDGRICRRGRLGRLRTPPQPGNSQRQHRVCQPAI